MNLNGSTFSATLIEPEAAFWSYDPHAGLVGDLLREQGDLTAVERFAQFHADAEEPLQNRYYSALLPAAAPGPGQQLGFEVDLDRCSGCKACVAACHTLNGLDDGESWRDVGLLIGGTAALPVIQHVTSACHHCVAPACLDACPVDAFEKDPLTGIVRHLDDQCFGCGYCTMACPYDAPKFHAGKGIVRKCDMCSERLAAGEAPACVQACPHEAIRIQVIDVAEVVTRAGSGDVVPGAPDPRYTLPATHYRTTHLSGPGGLVSEDNHHVEPEHAHWPLVIMLVLSQLSVGGFALEEALGRLAGRADAFTLELQSALCLGFAWAALAASVGHLGRPQYAYRAVIGLKHSWLSREVLAFGLFGVLATLHVVLEFFAPASLENAPSLRAALLAMVVSTGVAGVVCSVLVYHVVQRPFWRAPLGGIKFAGTSLVLGLGTALVSTSVASLFHSSPPGTDRLVIEAVAIAFVVASSGKLWLEYRLCRGFAKSELAALRGTARLLGGALARPAAVRRFLGVVGGVVLPLVAVAVAATATAGAAAGAAAALLALAVSIAGEMAERYLFFTAVVRPRMPGGWTP
jgi:formate dehydrogenase iron-sulfur subunit